MFEKILKWYKQGLWTEKMVNDAFNKGILTKEEVNKILGKEV
jgi:hypothetical protein